MSPTMGPLIKIESRGKGKLKCYQTKTFWEEIANVYTEKRGSQAGRLERKGGNNVIVATAAVGEIAQKKQ